ncbi:VOC family protein [Salinicoccus sp. HZC-1]|uniref:VOC family protein n=1 Tax=Salinicoccus sp. HZC-1 TaxID=3385497 RepID=UPI00398A7FB5
MSIVRGMNHIGLTVPDIESATAFFKKGLDAKVAYDSQTLDDPPRGGAEVERFLGIPKGSEIVKKRMIVIGSGPNIEMFQFENASSAEPLDLADHGYTHLSFYTDDLEAAFEKLKSAGGVPLSEIHENTKYEDTQGSGTVYFKTPWGSLIELQSIPNGYYYPEDSESEVFVPE